MSYLLSVTPATDTQESGGRIHPCVHVHTPFHSPPSTYFPAISLGKSIKMAAITNHFGFPDLFTSAPDQVLITGWLFVTGKGHWAGSPG